MSLIVNIGEAKTRLSELLARVGAGEDIIIARDGEPIARLAPLDERAQRAALIRETLAARDSGEIEDVTLEEILAFRDEGRKY